MSAQGASSNAADAMSPQDKIAAALHKWELQEVKIQAAVLALDALQDGTPEALATAMNRLTMATTVGLALRSSLENARADLKEAHASQLASKPILVTALLPKDLGEYMKLQEFAQYANYDLLAQGAGHYFKRIFGKMCDVVEAQFQPEHLAVRGRQIIREMFTIQSRTSAEDIFKKQLTWSDFKLAMVTKYARQQDFISKYQAFIRLGFYPGQELFRDFLREFTDLLDAVYDTRPSDFVQAAMLFNALPKKLQTVIQQDIATRRTYDAGTALSHMNMVDDPIYLLSPLGEKKESKFFQEDTEDSGGDSTSHTGDTDNLVNIAIAAQQAAGQVKIGLQQLIYLINSRVDQPNKAGQFTRSQEDESQQFVPWEQQPRAIKKAGHAAKQPFQGAPSQSQQQGTPVARSTVCGKCLSVNAKTTQQYLTCALHNRALQQYTPAANPGRLDRHMMVPASVTPQPVHSVARPPFQQTPAPVMLPPGQPARISPRSVTPVNYNENQMADAAAGRGGRQPYNAASRGGRGRGQDRRNYGARFLDETDPRALAANPQLANWHAHGTVHEPEVQQQLVAEALLEDASDEVSFPGAELEGAGAPIVDPMVPTPYILCPPTLRDVNYDILFRTEEMSSDYFASPSATMSFQIPPPSSQDVRQDVRQMAAGFGDAAQEDDELPHLLFEMEANEHNLIVDQVSRLSASCRK